MKVKFLSPVQHNADRFEIGDTADLPKPAAEQLIAAGAAETLDAATAKAAAKAKAEAEALAARRAAIEQQALELQNQLEAAETDEAKAGIQQQLDALKAQWDALG